MKRRTFLTSTAAASGLLSSTAGCLSSADGGASNLMLGDLADRPAVDSEFFQRRSSVQRVFLEATTGVKYGVTDSTTDWVRLPVGGAVEAPQTSELAAGELAVGFDDGSGAFELRAKDASGTEYRATVSANRLFNFPPSLDHRYAFEDDGDTSTLTDSVGTVDGTINGMTYSTSHQKGDLAGDFANDTVDNPGFGVSNTGVTIAFWAFPRTIDYGGNRARVIFFGDDSPQFEILLDTGDWNAFYYDGSSTRGEVPTPATQDAWQHVTYVWRDNQNGELYINGSPKGSATHNSSASFSGTANRIGLHGGGVGDHYDGLLDNLKYYSKALSDSEVSNLYNTGSIN